MEHSFDVKVAEKIGIEAAILLKNIYWWCKHNCANGKNIHDGQAWTFNSRRAYAELFPYMKDSRIRAALKLLQDEGYVKTGTFNKIAYDRTTWYTVTEAGCALLGVEISHLSNTPMDLLNTANASAYTPNDLSNTPMEELYTPDDTICKPYVNTDIDIEEEEADWQAVLKAYQDNVRPALGPMDFEMLASLHKDFGKEWILAGIEECVKSNVRNVRYLSSVLERWKTDGFKVDNRRKKDAPAENVPSDGRPPHIPAHWVKTGSGWSEPYID